jgi:hypothetical protein
MALEISCRGSIPKALARIASLTAVNGKEGPRHEAASEIARRTLEEVKTAAE